MGKEKGGFLTPKAIANRIKAKGLQKLRWYCQMCQKQCRDENGFKCHTMSESHQRQLLLVAESPHKFIDSFSKEFLDDFMLLLKRRFGTKRVHCNVVYQEYVSDRDHTHMNATKWQTLTGFVKFLGREGYCTVDETEKGWFITYIDRDPETIKRQEAVAKKNKMVLDDEERLHKFIEKQIKRDGAGSVSNTDDESSTSEGLVRENEDEKIKIGLSLPSSSKSSVGATSTSAVKPLLGSNVLKKVSSSKSGDKSSNSSDKNEKQVSNKRKLTALEEIMMEEEQKKQRSMSTESAKPPARSDHWIHEGIVVKIVSKKYGEHLYKKKGVIKRVDKSDRYRCTLRVLDSDSISSSDASDRITVDEAHLETVIPALGKSVLLVNGKHRGEEGVLQSLDTKAFSVSVKLTNHKDVVLEQVPYEHVCKLHSG